MKKGGTRMPIDQSELGRRIRQAREACGMTQEEVAERLGVSRPTVAQIELGNRAVSSLELDKLAYLFARDIREFLADDFAEDDVVRALFRSHREASEEGFNDALRECIKLGKELTNLEEILEMDRALSTVAAYRFPAPRSKWEAIQSGAQVARDERRRLGLGTAPIGDLVHLLEGQAVRTGTANLPDEVSGLTISDSRVGLFVVNNQIHAPQRQRFSWCHEYAHVLLDRDAVGLISRTSDRSNLVEVRANSFAANFLMPEEGVSQFLAALGKGAPSRVYAEVFDEAGVLPVDSRTEPGTQAIQLYDVVQLAHYFGVSVQSALYRLRNLRLIKESELEQLKAQDEQGDSKEIARLLGLPEPEAAERGTEFTRRFLGLALEALRRGKISKAKFLELARMVHVEEADAQSLLERSGLHGDEDEADDVLAPAM
jgi:Zn-dependent peptidase ImmA (M78 family)/transcriptional regulator with XRE-family HTH domain